MYEQSVRPVELFVSGFRDDFEGFVKKYENSLYRIAVSITGSKADAEDIIQEVFIKVFEKNPEFESPEHEKAWLMRVTVNLCRSRLRTAWWRRTQPLLESIPAELPDEQRLMETVLSLPANYRAVIHLYYYEGYSTAEISKIIRKKESTVRSLLTRARRKLKEIVKEEEL